MKKSMCFVCVILISVLFFEPTNVFSANHGGGKKPTPRMPSHATRVAPRPAPHVSHSAPPKMAHQSHAPQARPSYHAPQSVRTYGNSGITSHSYKGGVSAANRAVASNYLANNQVSHAERASIQKYLGNQHHGAVSHKPPQYHPPVNTHHQHAQPYPRPQYRPSYQPQRYYPPYYGGYSYGRYGSGFQIPDFSGIFTRNNYQYYEQPEEPRCEITSEIARELDPMTYRNFPDTSPIEPVRTEGCTGCCACCTCNSCVEKRKMPTSACKHESPNSLQDRVYYYDK